MFEQPTRTDIYAVCPCERGLVYSDGELTCPLDDKRQCAMLKHLEQYRVHCVRAANGDVIIVDFVDKMVAEQNAWSKHRNGHYRTTDGEGNHKYIHRLILEAGLVDHCNRCKWDNRRNNLRASDSKRNRHNTEAKPGSRSRFVGVDYQSGRWRARVQGEGIQTHHIGYYNTEEEAARAVNTARKLLYGDHAYLNEVEDE